MTPAVVSGVAIPSGCFYSVTITLWSGRVRGILWFDGLKDHDDPFSADLNFRLQRRALLRGHMMLL